MTFYATISLEKLPRADNFERVALGLENLAEKAAATGDPAAAQFAAAAMAEPAMRVLLEAIFSHSPFLSTCLLHDLEFTRALFEQGPDACFGMALAALDEAGGPDARLEDLMAALRQAKRRVALTVAVADLAATWPLEEITRALSRFADACLGTATAFLLRDAAQKGVLSLAHEDDPARDSGFIVLAMGKLGAGELNYSSDIDLILLYDTESVRTEAPDKLQQGFVRLARALVRILEERTADGYVFRTDLRLRPDPGSTPLVLSVIAAETYYESQGQNWERAAMIKARPAAGDLAAGARFLEHLRPFIWRKHLDFAAIADVQSIKRQIEAQRGGTQLAIEGHNIKLGRGGIREIEFFVQTQQLIWGGRAAEARMPVTLDALPALAEMGRIAPGTADDMAAAYRFLRTLEHRLQMIDDQQTQTLPDDPAAIAGLAAFLGLDEAEFRQTLTDHLATVARHYADLFEQSAPLGGTGPLVFTGEDHHPDTLATLTELGFDEPETASTIVRDWHRGRYRAMRSTRARELLTELGPALLAAIARGVDPDHALHRFDHFLEGLPAGVQLFSLLYANPILLDLLTEIMGSAPRLADTLSRYPLILDSVLTEDFFAPPPSREAMAAELERCLVQARDMEDILILSRRWSNDVKFQIGVQTLRNLIDVSDTGAALSDAADTAIATLTARVAEDFARVHGRFPGAQFAVLAVGKLGARELTESSDLDLVFVYDTGAREDARSDGAKPLTPGLYYQRFAQRLVTALTAPTGDGKLYEIDMRLRPSGNAGPLAVSLESFAEYQREKAWAWEHMAMTRARVVHGEADLAARILDTLKTVLQRQRDAGALQVEILEMRARIAAEHATTDPWAVKHVAGGLVDCEFIAQFLQLAHAAAHPEILSVASRETFVAAAAAGLIEPEAAHNLMQALALWRRIQVLLRLCLEPGAHGEETFPTALKQHLVEAEGVANFSALKERMATARETTRAHFQAIIGEVGGSASRS